MTYSWSSSLTNADEYFADSLPKRKGARADEWNGLENRQGCKPLGGSNPPPSARRFSKVSHNTSHTESTGAQHFFRTRFNKLFWGAFSRALSFFLMPDSL